MADPNQPGSPDPDPGRIPDEVEDQVLEILEETEAGPEREAALQALGLSAALDAAVRSWLQEAEGEESSGFLESPQMADPAEPADSVALPRRFGAYELQAILGRGGMGVVYRATDLRLGREVAVKVLPPHFADNPKRLQRFEREVRAVAALRHDHIIPVFNADKVGDTPFFTMELVQGRALDAALRDLQARHRNPAQVSGSGWLETLQVEAAASAQRTYLMAISQLVIEVAEALHHAHELGIVHRDVKPSNIMIRRDQRALLFDFGLARLDDEAAVTRTSEVLGSPHYMSPEQVRGQGEALDARTDIYSLGATMYELLTLQPPFQAANPQQIYQMVLNREPRRPSLINPEVPPDLETICLAAIEKDPGGRYPSAAALAADLRRFLRLEPVQARPIGRLRRGWRFCRRNRSAVALTLLLLVALGATWQAMSSAGETDAERRRRADAERRREQLSDGLDRARSNLDRLTRERALARKALDDLERKEARSRATLSQRAAELARLAQRQEAQREQLIASAAETRKLRRAANSQQQELARGQEQLRKTQAESRQLLAQIARQRQELARAQAALQATQRRFGDLQASHRLSRANRLLSEALGLRGSEPGLGLILGTEAAALLRPDDPATLHTRVDSTLVELLQASQEALTFVGHQARVTGLSFSPTGGEILSCAEDGGVLLWDRDDGQVLASSSSPTRSWVHIESFDRGRQALLAAENGGLYRWNLRSGSAPARLELARHLAGTPQHLGRNGRFLVSHVDHLPGRLQCWEVAEGLASAQAFVLGARGLTYANFRFGPIGNLLAATSTDGQLHVFDLPSRRSLQQSRYRSEILAYAFDTEARRLALLCADGNLKILGTQESTPVWEQQLELRAPLTRGELAFCDDDRSLLVFPGDRSQPLLFDLRVPKSPGQLLAGLPANPGTLCLDPRNQQWLALPNRIGSVEIYRLPSRSPLLQLRGHPARGPGISSLLRFSPDGQTLCSARGGRQIRVWRSRPGGALRRLAPGALGRSAALRYAQFTPSAQHIQAVGGSGLHFWFRHSGQHQLLGPGGPIQLGAAQLDPDAGIMLGPDRQQVLLVDGRQPRNQPRLRPIPLPSDQELEQCFAWPGAAVGLVLEDQGGRRWLEVRDPGAGLRARRELPKGRPGGGRILPLPGLRYCLLGHHELNLLPLQADRPARTLRGSRRPAVPSGDGRRLVAATGFGLALYAIPEARRIARFPALPDDVSVPSCLAAHPDSGRVASAWTGGRIFVHTLDDDRPQLHRAGRPHSTGIRSLCYSPDGSSLLSVGEDGRVLLLDPDTLVPRLEVRPDETCLQAGFSPDGKDLLLTTAGSLSIIPKDLRRLAALSRPRQLSTAERRRYGLDD